MFNWGTFYLFKTAHKNFTQGLITVDVDLVATHPHIQYGIIGSLYYKKTFTLQKRDMRTIHGDYYNSETEPLFFIFFKVADL